MAIIVRDVQDKQMTIYNPDGSVLVITHNMLCINDILLQIREQNLEGYTFQVEDGIRQEITKRGRINYGLQCVFLKQTRILVGLK